MRTSKTAHRGLGRFAASIGTARALRAWETAAPAAAWTADSGTFGPDSFGDCPVNRICV
jgi:hypothetical protein